MIQSVWKNLNGLQKAKSESQLNTSGVTLNADLETKTHHQTPMVYGYSHFIHFKTVATEVEIPFLSTQIMFPLLPQFGSAFFSSKEVGVQYNESTSHWCLVIHFWLKVLSLQGVFNRCSREPDQSGSFTLVFVNWINWLMDGLSQNNNSLTYSVSF